MNENLGNTEVILYGCGSTSYRVMEILLSKNIVPLAVVDGNPEKWGKEYSYKGYIGKISSYESVAVSYEKYTIILAVSIGNALEIKKELLQKGEKNPIVHMMCPFKVDDVLLDNVGDFVDLESDFFDEKSKKIFREFLMYKSTGNMIPMLDLCDGDMYFDKSIISPVVKHRFIDVGCYTGDTITQFLLFSENGYESITGLEADPGNSKRAQNFAKYARLDNMTIENRGGGIMSV